MLQQYRDYAILFTPYPSCLSLPLNTSSLLARRHREFRLPLSENKGLFCDASIAATKA